MSRSLLTALLAALALHLLFLFVLMAWLRPAQAAARQETRLVMVDVIHTLPELAPKPEPPQPPRPLKAKRSRSRPPRSPRSTPSHDTAPPPPRGEPAPGSEPELSLHMRAPALDLNLQQDPAGETPGGAHRDAPPGERAPGAESEASRVKGRVDDFLARTQALGNVRGGRAHPYLYNVLRALDRNFEPDLSMIPKTRRKAIPAYFRAYKAAATHYANMGQALPFDASNMGDEVIPPKMLEGFAEIEQAVREEGGQVLTAEVCLLMRPGAMPRVDTRRRCGVRELDRLTNQALDAALRQLARPAPTDMPPGRACYSFTVRFGRDLPRLGLSCGLDLALGTFSCGLPGGEYLAKQVNLTRLYLP